MTRNDPCPSIGNCGPGNPAYWARLTVSPLVTGQVGARFVFNCFFVDLPGI
ncbi:MAG TPA: hypothetical protein PKI19_11470 [Elusimicrobiales bacterium]|nr:hypothetical protein [Elusimicrobiales bacterium]